MNPKDPNSSKTKSRILKEASSLFAAGGYAGTSMREIAQKAEVNLAAINYHFTNKESLYWRVFEETFDSVRRGVERCGESTDTTVDLTLAVYDFFIDEDEAMKNIFKMFLSDRVSLPSVDSRPAESNQTFGPPGMDVFLQKIENDVGGGVSKEGKEWAAVMIFSLITHHGIVMNTEVMKKKCRHDPTFSDKTLKNYLVHAVQSKLNYICKNKDLKFS